MFPYWPRTVENRAALRTAISALAAILVAFAFHLPNPFWSGMSVVIVSNLYTGSIIDKAILRIVGTIIGAVLGFYIAGIVANSFFLFLLSCFLIIAVSVYFYYYSKNGYAYLLGALCAFIIISQITINPHNAFYVAIWRPIEIGVGVIVFALGVYSIFPNHLKDNIPEQVNDLFNSLSNEFKSIEQCIIENKLTMIERADSILSVKRKLRKATELIGSLNAELGINQAKVDELRAFLETFFTLVRQIHYLINIPYQQNDLLFLRSLPIEHLFAAMEEDLRQLQKGFSIPGSFKLKVNTDLLCDFEEKVEKKSAEMKVHSDFIYSFIVFLHQVNQNFSFLYSLLEKNPLPKKEEYIFLNKQDRIKSNNDLIQHSMKAGLAVLLALGFWLVSNWPGGINGIISSLVISIRLNLLEMKNVIIHRLIGCTLGGGLALASLALVRMNLYDFIVVLFFSVWGFSYFMFKFPKYSYIGLQANIALIIALAQEGGPPTLLDPPLQRLAGVVIGIVASFIVANILWRTDVWTVLQRYLEKLYHYITFNLQQTLLNNGKKTLHDLASLFWVARGLIESLGDIQLNSKKQNRLNTIRKRFETLVMTQATISYILSSIDRTQAFATATALNIDLSTYERKIITVYESRNGQEAEQLYQEIDLLKEHITAMPNYLSISFFHIRNLIAYMNALKQLLLNGPCSQMAST